MNTDSSIHSSQSTGTKINKSGKNLKEHSKSTKFTESDQFSFIRYTSSPHRRSFCEPIHADDYSTFLNKRKTVTGPLGLFVYLPFCRYDCKHCYRNKVTTKDDTQASHYIGYLEKEIALKKRYFRPSGVIERLALGGGSPTFFDQIDLMHLMHVLAKHFDLSDNDSREYLIEVDSRSVSPETLALLVGLGFNRLNIGIHDLDHDHGVRESIKRGLNIKNITYLVDSARQLGFKSIGLEIICGLPKQTETSIQLTLEALLPLAPDRLYFNNYVYDQSSWDIDKSELPSEAAIKLIHYVIAQIMKEAGYIALGVGEFARPDDDLVISQAIGGLTRDLSGFSSQKVSETLGLGLSAISQHTDRYVQNTQNLDDYYSYLDEGIMPVATGVSLQEDDKIRRFVIMQLLTRKALEFKDFNQRFNVDFHVYFSRLSDSFTELELQNKIKLSDKSLTLSNEYRYELLEICVLFDRYRNDSSIIYPQG